MIQKLVRLAAWIYDLIYDFYFEIFSRKYFVCFDSLQGVQWRNHTGGLAANNSTECRRFTCVREHFVHIEVHFELIKLKYLADMTMVGWSGRGPLPYDAEIQDIHILKRRQLTVSRQTDAPRDRRNIYSQRHPTANQSRDLPGDPLRSGGMSQKHTTRPTHAPSHHLLT